MGPILDVMIMRYFLSPSDIDVENNAPIISRYYN